MKRVTLKFHLSLLGKEKDLGSPFPKQSHMQLSKHGQYLTKNIFQTQKSKTKWPWKILWLER